VELGLSRTTRVAAIALKTTPPDHDALSDSMLRLSSGLLIIGTARFVCALGDYATSLLQTTRFTIPPLAVLSVLIAQNPPARLLASCWPLALAMTLRLSGSRVFLGASAMTFSMISVVGLLELLAGLTLGALSDLLLGSFVVPRWPLKHGNPAAVARTILGSIQLTMELAAAILACVLVWKSHRVAASCASDAISLSPRERMRGRLAMYLSLVFLALWVRIPVWSAYLDVLGPLRLARGLVAMNRAAAKVSNQNRPTNFADPRQHEMELRMWTNSALQLATSNQLSLAKDTYLKVIARGEALSRDGEPPATWKDALALALNNLSWLQATCDDARFRQPQNALSYAKRAVELFPSEGNYWNTLGVAYFRVGQWQRAKAALRRSMELRGKGQGDSHDWFFLAMIDAREGQEREARRWYDRAVSWLHERSPNDEELYRFQVEAALALGLPNPLAPNATAR